MTATEIEASDTAPATPAPAAGGPDRRFRGDIDGLRALAILLVVGYHVGLPGVSGGFIGVDVFFVISGYLITRNLVVESSGSGRVSLLSFWARRIRRLVPAMSLMIVVTLVASMVVLPALDLGAVVRQGAAASLYVSNLLFAREAGGYFAADVRTSPFLHTWSLGVEEQFYVVWPVMVGLITLALRRHRAWLRRGLGVAFALVLVVSFALCVRLTERLDPLAFYGLPTRAWEFAAAGLLALVTLPRALHRPVVRTIAAVLGVAVIVVAAAVLDATTRYPGAWALLPVGGTVLVILAGSAGDDRPVAVVAALGSRPARWVGRVSYSWYLWHWPFIVLAAAQFGDEVAIKAVAAAVALVVATAGHRWVENPVRFDPGLARSRRRTFVVGGVLTVGALLVGVAVQQSGNRFADDLDRMLITARGDLDRERCTDRPTSPGGIEYCLAGATGGSRTVMVIGDSHARQWSTALDEVAAAEGVRLVGRWFQSCPPIEIQLKPSTTGEGVVEACQEFRSDTWRLLDEIRPDAVILANADLYQYRILGPDGAAVADGARPALWRDGYRALLDRLRGSGFPVGVIRDNPQLAADPVACVARTRDVGACSPSRAETLAATSGISEAEGSVLADAGAIPQLSTVDTICDEQVCRVATTDHLVYADAGHLTTAFTESQAPALRQLLLDTLATSP